MRVQLSSSVLELEPGSTGSVTLTVSTTVQSSLATTSVFSVPTRTGSSSPKLGKRVSWGVL